MNGKGLCLKQFRYRDNLLYAFPITQRFNSGINRQCRCGKGGAVIDNRLRDRSHLPVVGNHLTRKGRRVSHAPSHRLDELDVGVELVLGLGKLTLLKGWHTCRTCNDLFDLLLGDGGSELLGDHILFLRREGQLLIKKSRLNVGVDLSDIQGIQLRLFDLLLLPVEEDIVDPLELVLRRVRHRGAKLNIIGRE